MILLAVTLVQRNDVISQVRYLKKTFFFRERCAPLDKSNANLKILHVKNRIYLHFLLTAVGLDLSLRCHVSLVIRKAIDSG